MYSSRGGINSMSDSKEEGGSGRVGGGTFVWVNLMGDFGESAIWQQRTKQWFPHQEMWLVRHSTLLVPVCEYRNAADVVIGNWPHLQYQPGDLIWLSTKIFKMCSCVISGHLCIFLRNRLWQRSWKWNSLQTSQFFSQINSAFFFFWQSCQRIQPTILVTHEANRNENIVSKRLMG